MINNLWKTLKGFFVAPTLKAQFEEMVLQEEVEKRNEVKPAVADYVPSHGAHAETVSEHDVSEPVTILAEPVHGRHAAKPVTDQITDSVTQVAPAKPKRAKSAKGKFKADDVATADTNEAWEGGVAPVKKPRKKKAE